MSPLFETVLIAFAVVGGLGVCCIVAAFAIAAVKGWDAVITKPRSEGRWTWAAILMVVGAALGIVSSVGLLIARMLAP